MLIHEIPAMMYGTAWKENATAALVEKAVSLGFRAIDTANQPRHYQEALVGEALDALADKGIARDQLFVQTKFTPADGHDHRIPYDRSDDLDAQVRQSFDCSLKNLRTDHVDSYLLHGPYGRHGLGAADWEVWHALEEIHRSGLARTIGISNVSREQLELLTDKADVKPAVVQNRCFASHGWDRSVREFCRSHDIVYQGFSLLTANVPVLRSPVVGSIARRSTLTIPQTIFRFASQVGMLPLTGTTDARHMQEDLRAFDVELSGDDVGVIETIAG